MNINKIATHDAEFHADDVAAITILSALFPDAEIVRSRDRAVLATADCLVDIGCAYDASKLRFDHHQRGGAGTRENGVPYASAGLVWRHFGEKYLHFAHGISEELCFRIYRQIDQKLFEGIDAVDAGKLQMQTLVGHREVSVLSLSAVIASLNPKVGMETTDAELQFVSFRSAMEVFKRVLDSTILDALQIPIWTKRVEEADEKSSVLVLKHPSPDTKTGWMPEVTRRSHIKFVVFPNSSGTGYHVIAARDDLRSFISRKPLPEAWGGLRGDELSNITGIEGCIFCHPGRWICGAKTEQAAIRLAQLAAKA